MFFGLLEQKLFRKTKGRQIKSQGCTFINVKETLRIGQMLSEVLL